MMNIQSLLQFRCLLLALLLGAQWCSVALIPYRTSLCNSLYLARQEAADNHAATDGKIGKCEDVLPLPAVLRFNGKTVVGLEDTLTLFQEVEASADSVLELPFDIATGSKDTVFPGSTAFCGQSLFLQHTRLQI